MIGLARRRRGFALLPWTITIVLFLMTLSMGFYGAAYVNWRNAEQFWGTMQARMAADSLLREVGDAMAVMLARLENEPGKGHLFVLQRMTGESGSDESALRAAYEEMKAPGDPSWEDVLTGYMSQGGMTRDEAVAALTQWMLDDLGAGDVPLLRQEIDRLFAEAEAAAATNAGGGSAPMPQVGLGPCRTTQAVCIYAGLGQAQGTQLTERIQLSGDDPWVISRGGEALETTLRIDMPDTDANGKWSQGAECIVTCSATVGQWHSGDRTLIFKRKKVKDPNTGAESFVWVKGLDILKGVRM